MAEKRAMKTYRGYQIVDAKGNTRSFLYLDFDGVRVWNKTFLSQNKDVRIARVEVREILPATKRRRA